MACSIGASYPSNLEIGLSQNRLEGRFHCSLSLGPPELLRRGLGSGIVGSFRMNHVIFGPSVIWTLLTASGMLVYFNCGSSFDTRERKIGGLEGTDCKMIPLTPLPSSFVVPSQRPSEQPILPTHTHASPFHHLFLSLGTCTDCPFPVSRH